MKRRTRTEWLLSLLMLVAACGDSDSGSNIPPIGTAGTTALPFAGTSVPAAGSGTRPAAGTGVVTPSAGTTAPPVAGTGVVPSAGAPAAGGGAGASAAGAGATAGTSAGGDCQGFKLEGLMYSPGGEVLPNKCEPFHPTRNNPYAVRCVDAWPWYKTKYPGDDYCILPPPPDKGVQYGVHPQGAKWYEQVSKGDVSGYDNLADLWLMNDGEEEQANYETKANNPSKANFYRSHTRMRPGSHHMIVNSDPNKPGNEMWIPTSGDGLIDSAAGLLALPLPGAQRPDENRPPSLEKPQEDSGLYREFPAMPKVTYNMHHFNASGKQILKEAWTNLWWESDARTMIQPMRGLDVGQVLTMAIPPGATQDLHYSWKVTQPFRLVEAFGHRHAWTTNFSAWIKHPDGKTEIVYQSFEWLDEPTYRYDSLTKNPAPAPEMRADGGHSGVKMVMPGQELHFNCHIEFTAERAASEKAPSPSSIGTLGFANEAFTGEMCILFGSTVGVTLPAPLVDTSPLPSFATID